MMTSQIKEPSISTIMSIPDGKILDFLTKRFVNDTPEEYVRQNIEKALVRQYKYPIDSCKPEVSIKVGSSNKRVDVVIFEENKALAESGNIDYPIFMAVAEKIGHDKRGATIYKRDAEGNEILSDVNNQEEAIDPVTGKTIVYSAGTKDRVVDDDMPDVVAAFKKWQEELL